MARQLRPVRRDYSDRAGKYVRQPQGHQAFIPNPLPPDPPLTIDTDLALLLSTADQCIGRLDGVTRMLPNPDPFVAMYVRQEAVLSSQIEGTQSTLQDVLAFELEAPGVELPRDIEEVVNYVRAMNYGLGRLANLPLSLRLIREIHGELLKGVRGGERQPGEFRKGQNWIGQGRVPITKATFVPPPIPDMNVALRDFERFLHDESFSPLVHAGLVHAQFETIHPFMDGNGRVVRLLITFLLVHRGVLQRPLLYLSAYLKEHQREYYRRLMGIRDDGDWEGWLSFFLRGVAETAQEATEKAGAILRLRETHRGIIQENGVSSNGFRLLDLLFEYPLMTGNFATNRLDVSFPTASSLLQRFEALGLLREMTGHPRNRIYRYTRYFDLFEPAQPTRRSEEETEVTNPL